jgi:hypothetical protein
VSHRVPEQALRPSAFNSSGVSHVSFGPAPRSAVFSVRRSVDDDFEFCRDSVPGKVVAQLMGHANVGTTRNVYTQVLDGSLRAAVDRVGGQIVSRLFTTVHQRERQACQLIDSIGAPVCPERSRRARLGQAGAEPEARRRLST